MQPIPFTSGHLGTGVVLGILVLVNFILIMVYVIGGMQSSLVTREFPDIKFRDNIIVVSGNRTIKASESGSVIMLQVPTTTGASIVLPPPKKGLRFNFKVISNFSNVSIDVADPASHDINGALSIMHENGVNGAIATFPSVIRERIFLTPGDGGDSGTNFDLVAYDGTSWNVSGKLVSASAPQNPFRNLP